MTNNIFDMTKEKEVILTINGKSHKLSKPKDAGGGKQVGVCPKCSLFQSHFDFCWKNYYGIVRPLCSIVAESNCWDNDFMTYFQEYKIKNIKTNNKSMRTVKQNFEDKARLVGDISYFIDALEHPLENEDDNDATLCVTIQESGVRTTRIYSEHELAFEAPSMWSDGTIKETEKLLLDKETRDCIVNALKERLGQLKKEIKGLI